MHKLSRKSAKVFHEKDATLIAEKVCVLKQLVGGWWEEKVDRTPCNGATAKHFDQTFLKFERRAVYGKSVRAVR